jgi:23S rRNA (guanosine2251-2'-O)-methyltransferase
MTRADKKTGGSLFCFGVNPVAEKLRSSPAEIFEIIMADKGAPRGVLRAIEENARRRGIAIRYVPVEMLDRLAQTDRHQGVVARVLSHPYRSLSDLESDVASAAGPDCILCLDGITDPRNLGALLRSAEGAGVRRVVIPKDRSASVTATVIKASAGAVHYLTIYRVANLRAALLCLKGKGYWVVGLDSRADQTLYGRDYPDRLAAVLGAEGGGIRPLIKRECDFLLSIPMRGKVESLNVAVAGAIFLYELMRCGAESRPGKG